jgi:hypothetical protein
MPRTEEIEREERERRWEQSRKLQGWADELKALGKKLWDEDSENGWEVPPIAREPQLTVRLLIDGVEFARFVRDETGLIGVFEGGEPKRYASADAAFDDAVKRRMWREKKPG